MSVTRLTPLERLCMAVLVTHPSSSLEDIMALTASPNGRQLGASLRTLAMAGLITISAYGAKASENTYSLPTTA
jgi:hypothetical protein